MTPQVVFDHAKSDLNDVDGSFQDDNRGKRNLTHSIAQYRNNSITQFLNFSRSNRLARIYCVFDVDSVMPSICATS